MQNHYLTRKNMSVKLISFRVSNSYSCILFGNLKKYNRIAYRKCSVKSQRVNISSSIIYFHFKQYPGTYRERKIQT